jgi:subtilisin family serine protease
MSALTRGLLLVPTLLLALAFVAPAHAAGGPPDVQVVVLLDAPPLATATASSRVLTAAARSQRLSLRTPTSVSYMQRVTAAQRALEVRIRRAVPGAHVRWRYQVVLNALAVVVPANRVRRLAALPGVRHVYGSVRYRARLDRSPALIGAPTLWGQGLSTAGQGTQIGIIDDGIDQTHPFFDPAGFAMPAGFPKGNASYTTAKVVVARAFPPASPSWRHASKPFDPEHSGHATHVAGIAAGNNGVTATAGRVLSGVAPRAQLGNYKVLTIPTASGVGLDGNSPEITAGIEAAVRDGMDVINLSIGEPEVEPARDLVIRALNAAADAGVVPVVSAGNDFDDFGRGSVGSPAAAANAITVAAATKSRDIAGFSSAGPTPISLQFKPDVTAPGASILSSVPGTEGAWTSLSGTSMSSPHVAGAVAVLRQRHPDWSVAQLKSALALTGDDLRDAPPPTRQGGGLVNLARADAPLLFAAPTSLSFGRITQAGQVVTRTVTLTDSGGGAGTWNVTVERLPTIGSAVVEAPATVAVPGSLTVTARTTIDPSQQTTSEAEGYVVLSRGSERRRIPFWLIVENAQLGAPSAVLRRTGAYRGDTRGKASRVTGYRFPEQAPGISTSMAGPEQVFRVVLERPLQNLGVAITGRASNAVRVDPRIVYAGNEHRLAGYTALPLNNNPYLRNFMAPQRVAGVAFPAAGAYDIVFDSGSPAEAGRFTFRFWANDTRPPTVRLLTPSVRRGGVVRLSVVDAGASVDPSSVIVSLDGRPVSATLSVSRGRLSIRVGALGRGRHRVAVQVSDYQETKNNENQSRILPNTARFSTTFRIR